MSVMPTIVPISELRQDASAIIKQASSSGDPVFITQHRSRLGRTGQRRCLSARRSASLEMLRILAQGEADIAAGNGVPFEEVMAAADDLLDRP